MSSQVAAEQATRGRFAWHELATTDPKAAEQFYSAVVGWTPAPWQSGEIDYTLFMSGEAPIAGLMPLADEAKAAGAPPSWLAYIEVPNVDETVAQATGLGAQMVGPAVDVPGVGRFAVLRDPQGAAFAVHKSETPTAEETDPRPLEFSWHELATTDYQAADRFYSQLFGWETKSDMDMGPAGIYHMFGRDRFTYGGMYNKPDDMPAPPHWVHYALVDSADAAAERATAHGGQVLVGPMEVPGGDRIAVIVDPQGATFAVHSKAG
ncbi:MAG TPA: VOC family protein [Longimicrobiales bacterium]|nr:VOC family protein [Longimicrobiales bacterium]